MDAVGDWLPLLFLSFIIILALLLIVLCFFYLSSFSFFLLGLLPLLFGRFLNLMVVVLIRIQIFIIPFEYDCLLLTDAAHSLFKGLSLLATRCLLRLFPLSPMCARIGNPDSLGVLLPLLSLAFDLSLAASLIQHFRELGHYLGEHVRFPSPALLLAS